jgi:curved DNA-binding protein
MPDFEFEGTGFSDFFEQLFGRQGMGGRGARGGGFTEQDFAQPGDDVEADIMVTLEEAAFRCGGWFRARNVAGLEM